MAFLTWKSVAWILVLAAVGARATEEDRKRQCGKGCYEVLGMDGQFKECDCCEKSGGLLTPCAVTMCSPGAQCVVVKRPCEGGDHTIGCDHDLQATCRAPCKKEICKEGYTEVYQSNGCTTCIDYGKNFTNPCHYTRCANCVLVETQCETKPCYPKQECRGIVECPLGCVKYLDDYGTESCECCNGCVDKSCKDGSKCTLSEINCIRAPCPFPPSC